MNMRVDIVSKKTGRVLLSSLFDSPPEGLTRRECQRAITIIKKTKERLEAVFGEGSVRVSLDDYATSVFWYIVLFRPIAFDPDDPWFGDRPWCLYDLLEDPKMAAKLKEMDLGVVYDPERNWLTLIWDEALKGILEGIDSCPSWRNILKEYEARTEQPATTNWWKLCARSHSFVLPSWRVAKHGYLRGVLWHRPEIEYSDIVVFDLRGIDIPKMNEEGVAELPVAKRARFVHFYTDDKREFQHVRRTLRPRAWTEKQRSKSARRAKRRREEKKEKFEMWITASRAVADICKIMGGGIPGRRGMFLAGNAVTERFYALAQLFNQGKLRITHDDEVSWGNIEHSLDTIEECLNFPYVPDEFRIWLNWRNKGEVVNNLNIPEE